MMSEVEEIYLPLSRLLNLYVAATQELYKATQEFLGGQERKVPYIIGMAGSVAAGKSTTARILQCAFVPLAKPPESRPGADRRLPAAQCGTRKRKPDEPQRLSGKL